MKVEIKLEENAQVPIKSECNAMCYDCYAFKITSRDDGKIEVNLGFSAKPPKGYGIRLIPRSNLTKYWWVLNNSIGIGDEDYKGNYKAIFTPIPKPKSNAHGFSFELLNNFFLEPFPYSVGNRICQMEIYKREDFDFEVVSELSGNDRGGGFGSSGLN